MMCVSLTGQQREVTKADLEEVLDAVMVILSGQTSKRALMFYA